MAENKTEDKAPEQKAATGVSQEEFDALKIQLAEQQKKLEALSAGPEIPGKEEISEIPDKTFKYKNREFKFKFAQFIIPGIGKRTATEALTDNELLKKLVETNSGLIKEVF